MMYFVVLIALSKVWVIRAAAAAVCSAESQLPCAAGCYFNTETIKCEDTPAGRFSPADDNYQYRCPPGSFSVGAAASCIPCPEGHFANENASTSCHPCGIAQYSATSGAKHCKSCNPARYIGYGTKEVFLEYGITFCVEPELTIPPTKSPTRSPMPTSSPTMVPALRRTSSPETSDPLVKPSMSLSDWDLADKFASSYPTVVEQTRPSSTPTLSPTTLSPRKASPSAKPSDSGPSHQPSPDSSITGSPTVEAYDSLSTAATSPPTLVTTSTSTLAPTRRLNTTESAHSWIVLLPNFLVTCMVTSFACCCYIASHQHQPEQESEKANDDDSGDEVFIDEEVTMSDTTTLGASQPFSQ